MERRQSRGEVVTATVARTARRSDGGAISQPSWRKAEGADAADATSFLVCTPPPEFSSSPSLILQ